VRSVRLFCQEALRAFKKGEFVMVMDSDDREDMKAEKLFCCLNSLSNCSKKHFNKFPQFEWLYAFAGWMRFDFASGVCDCHGPWLQHTTLLHQWHVFKSCVYSYFLVNLDVLHERAQGCTNGIRYSTYDWNCLCCRRQGHKSLKPSLFWIQTQTLRRGVLDCLHNWIKFSIAGQDRLEHFGLHPVRTLVNTLEC